MPEPDLNPHRLPSEVGIYTVAELRQHWLAHLLNHDSAPGADTVRLDASGVQQFDAAGAQALMALAHALDARGQHLRLQDAPEVVRNGCRTLGLLALLDNPAVTEGPQP